MLFRAIYVDYETVDDELIVRLGGRDENGDRRVINVKDKKPYIFTPTAESDYIPTNDDRIETQTRGYESFDDKKLTKLELSHPSYAKRPDDSEDSVRNELLETYESDILFYRRCAIDGLIGHIEIPSYKNTIHVEQIDVDPEVEEPIDPRICIADIEVLPDYETSFVEMKEEAKQPIICTTMWDSYQDEYTVIAQDPDQQIDTGEVKEHMGDHWGEDFSEYIESDMRLIRVGTDTEMAEAIAEYFENTRFDVVSGWNFVDFDIEYILRFLDNQGVSIDRMGDVGQTKDPEWASGDDEYPGIMERAIGGLPSFDMMEGFAGKMSFHNWRSKALDYVSDEVLGVGKVEGIDFTETYENDYSKLIAYNIIDVQLLVALDKQREIHDFFFNLGDLCSIPIYDTFHEKRQVDGYILSRRDDDEVLPIQEKAEEIGNAGGLVLQQEPGIEDWVGVFDLKSLYPSCIITCNISPETMGGDDVVVPSMPEKADDVGGEITQEDIDWENPMQTFSLENEGIIPKYVKKLFTERSKYKTLRDEHESGSREYELNDQRQRSIKILMNSMYGVASSKYWRLAVPGLGDAVTGAGRYVLWYGARHIRDIGYRVAYGDSVPGFEPTPVKIDGESTVCPIEEIPMEKDIEVWTDTGWSTVEERIEKPNRKEMYRVRTRSGLIHVTEDHGLLKPDGQEISPVDIEEGDLLMHSPQDYQQFRQSGLPDKDEYQPTDDFAWFLGVFVGDGSAGIYDTARGEKAQWKISKDDKDLLERAERVLRYYHDVDTAVESLDNSETARLRPTNSNDGELTRLASEYRDMCYTESGKKKIPQHVLNGSRETVLSFLDGYRCADGEKDVRDKKIFKRSYTNSAALASGMGVLAERLGLSLGVGTRDNHDKEYYRMWFRTRCRGEETEVIDVEKFDYDGESVYDLSTDSGHFNAGIGSLTVHNTDSAMVNLYDDDERFDREKAKLRGSGLESEVNTKMNEVAEKMGIGDEHPYLADSDLHGSDRHALMWEFEKLYKRLLLSGRKKRYAGHKIWDVDDGDVDEIGITGFESQRSDSTELAAEVQEEVISKILKDASFETISDYVGTHIDTIKSDIDIRKHGIPSVVNKDITDYPNGPRKRAVQYSNQYLNADWGVGDSPWLVYVDETPDDLPPIDVIAIEWTDSIPDGFTVDGPKMVEKNLQQPLDSIIGIAGYDWREIKSGRKAQSIEPTETTVANPFKNDDSGESETVSDLSNW